MQRVHWKEYSVHDDEVVKGFFGDYRWLSNFHVCDVYYNGLKFESTEAAYMAAKCETEAEMRQFQGVEPKEARRLGQLVKLRPDWDTFRLEAMAAVNFDKYWRNLDVRQKLIDTGDRYLEETNAWHDLWYGRDYKTGQGQNHLGRILMRIRKFYTHKVD